MENPLKEKARRLPGQSLDEELQEFIDDGLLHPFMMVVMTLILIVITWLFYFFPNPNAPIIITVTGVSIVIWYVFLIRKNLQKARNIRLGRDGERVVGQALEELRSQGCVVFHDIQGDNFNIDHTLICPQGVYTIETKTRSKKGSNERVTFDGTNLVMNGFKSSKVIKQAFAQSSWLHRELKNRTGKPYPVKPVMVFPGWYVDSEGGKMASSKGLWLLNHKALPEFIKNSPEVLSEEEIKLIASHIRSF